MEVQSYKLAIQYLQAERYEEAAQCLETLVRENPVTSEYRWALGLLYVISGNPYEALKQWEHINGTSHLQYKQRIEEKIPLYNELYQKYNQALHLVENEEFNQAKNSFHALLSFQTEVPLPIDFYHGYLLALIVTGEEDAVASEINYFPLYVKNSSVIRELEQMLSECQPLTPTVEGKSVSNKDWRKLLFIGSSLVASLWIGGVSLRGFSQQEDINVAKPVMEQQAVSHHEKEIGVSQSGSQIKQQELNDTSSFDDVGPRESSTSAGLGSYRKGLIAFRNQDYQSSVTQMEKSLSLQPNEYYSDDALFFLIESKLRLNEKENILNFYDHFLSQTSKHYALSPYTDEIMLGKAKLLMEDGRFKEAKPLLEKILSDYSHEWTSAEAGFLMKQIKNRDT